MVYSTLEAGNKAREALLFGNSKQHYNKMSISDAISTYAPSSDHNDVPAYIAAVIKAVGVGPDTILGSLNPKQRTSLLDAMKQHEGFKEGVVKQAAKGGVFSGPKSGYPMELHGSEMVTPLDLNSVLMKLAKTPASDVIGTTGPKGSNVTNTFTEKTMMQNEQMLGMLSAKMDRMIAALETGNNTSHKILQNARV